MQMTFNIPAALGVGLVTSIIGTLTASNVGPGSAPNCELAAQYADAVQDGDMGQAEELQSGLPQGFDRCGQERRRGCHLERHHHLDAGAGGGRPGRCDLRLVVIGRRRTLITSR